MHVLMAAIILCLLGKADYIHQEFVLDNLGASEAAFTPDQILFQLAQDCIFLLVVAHWDLRQRKFFHDNY